MTRSLRLRKTQIFVTDILCDLRDVELKLLPRWKLTCLALPVGEERSEVSSSYVDQPCDITTRLVTGEINENTSLLTRKEVKYEKAFTIQKRRKE